MTPEGTLRFRRATAVAGVAWALLALSLGVYGQWASARSTVEPPLRTTSFGGFSVVSVSAEAAAAGVERGQRVLEVDGLPIPRWYRERGWERVARGEPVAYRIVTADGGLLEVELLPRPRTDGSAWLLVPLFAALVLVGACFLIVGLFVWRLRPDRAESWAFLLFSSAMATTLFSAVNSWDAPFGHERVLLNLPFVGATMFHLFTVFPTEPEWIARRRALRAIPYAVAGVVTLLVVAERASGSFFAFLSHLSYGLAAAGGTAALVTLVHERLRLRGSAGAGAGLVLTGALASFLPVAVLATAYHLFPIRWPFESALILFLAFPVSVAIGIVRGKLFEVTGVARSSAAYGLATLGITALFAVLIALTDITFRQFNQNATTPLVSGAFLFFAILAFNPLRTQLQTLVDRFFDRDHAGYRDALRETSEAMVSMLSLSEISERLLDAATDAMGVTRAMVLLLDEDTRRLRAITLRGDWDEDARAYEISVDHPLGRHLWMRRQELSRVDFDDAADAVEREACWDVFDALEVRLLVPILFGVDLLGVIAVGAKLGGERFGADDRQLLRTLANQSATAIENAKAFDEIAKLNETLEARVEERTRELQDTQAQLMQSEKMRSLGQLVAGVAHELNNPIGFVHANLQLLDGYIRSLTEAQQSGGDVEKPRAAIRKLLARSREGTERVKRIVLDLRTFSRTDQSELSDANLNEELARTLALMEPRFKGGIRVTTQFGALPRVRCYPAQLNQVFMNLLMNAGDALEGRGEIVVRSRRAEAGAGADGGVVIEFQNDGPAIPALVRERIFEPFFTTKPVGQGTGLGLSISHQIVARHGGELSVHNPETGGACFRIELPLIATSPEDGDAAG